jgi:flagellar protein FliS
MLKAAQAYFQTQVTTTSQGHLLLMLYDGAIKFLKLSKVKIQEKNYAEKGMLISRAMDVINELDSSLNRTKGGDLAVNLHNLYFFCNTRLLNANLRMDCGLVDEVIKILSGLRDAFAQIQGMPQTAQRPAQTTAPAAPPVSPAPVQPRGNAAAQAEQPEAPKPQSATAPEQVILSGPPLRASASAAPPQPAPSSPRRPPLQQAKPMPATAQKPAPMLAPAGAPAATIAAAAPSATAQPKANDPLPPPKPSAGKLLARSNLYKKMATQT